MSRTDNTAPTYFTYDERPGAMGEYRSMAEDKPIQWRNKGKRDSRDYLRRRHNRMARHRAKATLHKGVEPAPLQHRHSVHWED